MRRPAYRLTLGAAFDTRYEVATATSRVSDQRRMLVVFFVFYAAAIGLDAMLGVLQTGLHVRFAVTAPLVLVCGLLLSARWPRWLQGLLGSLPVMTMATTIPIIGFQLEDMFAQRYMFAAGMFALHVNISYVQRWSWTVGLAIGNAVMVWGVLLWMRGWPGAMALADLATFNSVATLGTLYWSFTGEQGRRNAFLYDLLATLQAATLRQANTELQALSLTDELTGLSNRRAFDQEFRRARLHAQRTGQALGLLLVDIDHFKAFNDTAGHLAGDACLRRVADVIRGTFDRSVAFPARYGGEEFAVILPGCDAPAAREAANRLREAVLDCGMINPGRSDPAPLSVSVGFVASHTGDLDMTAMLRAADAGLYRAKDLGRNRVAAAQEGLLAVVDR